MSDRAPTAVVTGGTRGLGRELSLAFARRGYRVLSLYHRDGDAARALDHALHAEGLPGRSLRHDVTATATPSDPWSEPEIREASALVLVHNAAAAFEPKPLHLLTWDDFAAGIDVAVKGLWASALGLLRPMLATGGGTIVSVLTSALSARPPKGFAAYLAAKAAQQALIRSLAAEYGDRGIRTLTVSPGFMPTALTEAWHPSLRAAILDKVEMAEPRDIAQHICGLVEDPTVAGRGENHDV